MTLRWRFNEQSLSLFVNLDAAKEYLRALFAEATLLWGLYAMNAGEGKR